MRLQKFEGMLLAFRWPGQNARYPEMLRTPLIRKNSQDDFGVTDCTSCIGKPCSYWTLELSNFTCKHKVLLAHFKKDSIF